MTLERTQRFLRRRAGVIGVTFAGGALLTSLAVVLPTPRFVARASVAPAGPGYATPVAWLVAQISSRTLLADVTYAAFKQPVGDPAEALRAPGHDLVEAERDAGGELAQLAVWVGGPSKEEALKAAERLRTVLLEADRTRRAALAADEVPGEPPGPSLAELRVERAALRQRHPPRLVAERLARAAAAADAAARAREAATVAQLDHTTRSEEVARLEAEVDREARRAYLAHRAEAQAEALARAQEQRRQQQADPQAERPAGPSRSEVLRGELQRMLAKWTPRHPEVRRLQRQLDLELERERREGTAAAASREDQAAAPERPQVGPQVGERSRGFVLAGADEAGTLQVPDGWRQRAPSYAALLEARRQEREAALAQALAARRADQEEARAARLGQQVTALRQPRLEAERLEGAIEQLRRAGPEEPARAAGPPLVSGGPPLIVTVIGGGARFGWGLTLAALAALLAGLLAERQDRTIYAVDDILGAAPVLGAIPRVRGR